MKLYVGVTDNDWYRFLSQLPGVDEVNFWQPGGKQRFQVLAPGELFLFKLKAPERAIAGGAFFTYATLLPVSLAWEAFGEKNGTDTFQEMRAKIAGLKSERVDPHEDFRIGCILLQEPFFLPENEWIPTPNDFKKEIVQGKTYDATYGTGKALWDAVQIRIRSRPVLQDRVGEGDVQWNQTTVWQRLGQGSFRVLVTDTYQRQCAVTHEKALPALEAAHIRPVAEEGKHRIDNGLLLRSDVHKLLDAGYVTITPEYKFRASRKLKDEFHNGEEYFRLDGSPIWLPRDRDSRPNREFLEWHSDRVFRG